MIDLRRIFEKETLIEFSFIFSKISRIDRKLMQFVPHILQNNSLCI